MSRIVVFDTNILLSAIDWQGKPYGCVELARSGVVEAITCAELLDELSEKLVAKLLFSPAQSSDSVVDLLTFLRVVAIPGLLRAVAADPDDDKTLECAVIGTQRTSLRAIDDIYFRWEIFKGFKLSQPRIFWTWLPRVN